MQEEYVIIVYYLFVMTLFNYSLNIDEMPIRSVSQ